MIPTSIDGTDITGATIDGTDVTEITVDGQTVFTAETLPVAYSNLIAWYPFDSAEYGGSNADDVTALFNPGQSGDSTAYDGTVNGATYQSSGGVTDINAGPNSGAFDFDGSNDDISLPGTFFDSTSTFSLSCWFETDTDKISRVFNTNDNTNGFRMVHSTDEIRFQFEDSGNIDDLTSPFLATNTPTFLCVTFDDSINEANGYFANSGVPFTNFGTTTTSGSGSDPLGPFIGRGIGIEFVNGRIDDLRIYNKALSSSEVQQIYQNTQP